MDYEYMPPHGKPVPPKSRPQAQPKPTPSLRRWEVRLPLGSELIVKQVTAESSTKAFRKAVMELARTSNQSPSLLFRRLYGERLFEVKEIQTQPTPSQSSFLVRAYTPNPKTDLDRISRLKLVDSARLYSKDGNQVVYRATMPTGVTMAQVRELTGYIQNLFGARLLSSGPTQEKADDGSTKNVVEVRVSLLELV